MSVLLQFLPAALSKSKHDAVTKEKFHGSEQAIAPVWYPPSGPTNRDYREALQRAQRISDPWFRSQALAWVARYADGDAIKVARQAAKTANECEDEYKRTAVRAWAIAALAERSFFEEARKELRAALSQSRAVIPLSSRAEALMLLLHAALRIGVEDARHVADQLKNSCGQDSHWRCKRAVRDAGKLIYGEGEPRPFFW